MKILNLYFSASGNTEKVAQRIDQTIRELGHEVETVRVGKDRDLDLLAYDVIFVGSGVYHWLPGKPMLDLIHQLTEKYRLSGEIKAASPRRPGKKTIVYCTFGGGHTGENEAAPVVKYLGQLFDHLGYEIIAEWYLLGEFHGNLQHLSINGRLGNIQGRPSEADLQDVAQKVTGILQV
ncbi:MAG: flavodoxin family protein [Desulfobaccales bacterium]